MVAVIGMNLHTPSTHDNRKSVYPDKISREIYFIKLKMIVRNILIEMHTSNISILIHILLDMFGAIICFVEIKHIEMVELDMAQSTSWKCRHEKEEENVWPGNLETQKRGRRQGEV